MAENSVKDWLWFAVKWRTSYKSEIPPQSVAKLQGLHNKYGGEYLWNICQSISKDTPPRLTQIDRQSDVSDNRRKRLESPKDKLLTSIPTKRLTQAEQAEIDRGWNECRQAFVTIKSNPDTWKSFWTWLRESPSYLCYRSVYQSMGVESPIILAKALEFQNSSKNQLAAAYKCGNVTNQPKPTKGKPI